MDKRIKYHLVLDVETTALELPLIYDIGYAVTDRQGRIYETRSFIIQEVFSNKELMAKSFFAKKIPQYYTDINSGIRKIVPFTEMRIDFLELMKKYNIDTIAAYNLNFDKNALSSTMKFLTGNNKFLTSEQKEVKLLCIWSFACEVIYTQKKFKTKAEEKHWKSDKGNYKTSAEIGYRYLKGLDDSFEESHTGLEDVNIEIEIMVECYKKKKAHKSGIIPNPWRIPNQKEGK